MEIQALVGIPRLPAQQEEEKEEEEGRKGGKRDRTVPCLD